MSEAKVLLWYEKFARPFLEKHAPERLAAVEGDYQRLRRLLAKPDEVTVCFLGNSGVGKSTLLNALAAGERQVLPAGGIGPLTAQATEVRYSEERRFRVVYHPKGHLWKLAFALEARLTAERRLAEKRAEGDGASETTASADIAGDLSSELTEVERQDAKDRAALESQPGETEGQAQDGLEGYIKQAKNIVCGNQFADRPLSYLVDGLRVACGQQVRWGSALDVQDLARIERVHHILKSPKESRSHERREGSDPRGFHQDMVDHAAGFLSPLIERIEVGWPSEVLKSGVVLVDLPGVGIAQDAYREVTSSYVRDKARAVIVVVDRAGPTESTVDLLRTSGYWERLVGASDDPMSDACTMMIAVTRVDDVTQTEWENRVSALPPGVPKPKKREVFAQLVEEFKPRMKAQISDQLGRMGASANESVNAAREQARTSILNSLEIHPVSAPELKKILQDDEDDRAFLQDAEQTGIPLLQQSLMALASAERVARQQMLQEIKDRLAGAALSEIRLIQSVWQQESRAEEEAERLEQALQPVLAEKKGEYRARVAAFREFLEETVQARIEALVLEARDVAEHDVSAYLYRLRSAHWTTLRAAVRRGGAFYGSRNINLPEDITGYFQEPMAAVWSQKLLRQMRKRTGDLSADMLQMVEELCSWANEHGGASVNKKLLATQKERIAVLADQMKSVGKEAVDELRDTVKKELSDTVRKPIKLACETFVRDGNDMGAGVKHRIIDLFAGLARTATDAARDPAIRILQANAARVRAEIQKELKNGGDPIQDTADLIVEKHEDRLRRSDAQRRRGVLREVQEVLDNVPGTVPVDAALA